MFGWTVNGDASKYTNLISAIGTKFFPMAKLPAGSAIAKFSVRNYNTVRVFGFIGRGVAPWASVGLAIIDGAIIGKCAYVARTSREKK